MTAPPSHNMVVTFLGTTSGGGPTDTRNCSSLVLDPLGTGTLWMVDCAEGTVRQFATQPYNGANRVKSGSVNKIFVTHMHADHIMGVITFLRNALGFFRGDLHAPPPVPRPVQTPRVEVYGPAGIRAFIRTMFKLTHNRSSGQYCAHELLNPGEAPSAPKDDLDDLHINEEPGEDFVADEDGCWRGVAEGNIRGNNHRVVVDAGPIHHRAPCLGYVFREELAQTAFTDYMTRAEFTIAPRSVVILGDTSDPTALIPLIAENPRSTISLLVHEATDAYMPPHIDPNGTTGRNRTEEIVTEKALDKGHSTPAMAGRFARQIGAERLALNHIGARFPAPPQFPRSGRDHFRRACMQELEDQANREWRPLNGERARAVNDFDYIIIPPNQRQYPKEEDIDALEVMQNTIAYESEGAAVAQTSTTVRATHVERKPRWRHGSGEPGSSQRPHQRQHHHNERGGHPRKRGRNDASSGRDSGQGHRQHERGGHRGGHRKARKDESNVRME